MIKLVSNVQLKTISYISHTAIDFVSAFIILKLINIVWYPRQLCLDTVGSLVDTEHNLDILTQVY